MPQTEAMISRRCISGVVIVVVSTIGTRSVAGFADLPGLAGLSFAANEGWMFQKRPIRLFKASRESQEVIDKVQSKQSVTARSVAAHALMESKKLQSVPSLQRLESDPLFNSIGDQRDRSFARLLVTTVERRMGQIDKVLEKCKKSNRPKVRKGVDDLYVQACLRIGAAQLLFIDTPAYAAVKETIDVLRQDVNVKVP
jgi:transcription termination factor NusB